MCGCPLGCKRFLDSSDVRSNAVMCQALIAALLMAAGRYGDAPGEFKIKIASSKLLLRP
jgi:hypothetical protein